MPRLCSFTPGKTRYPLYRRLGGVQGRSGRVRKISPSTEIQSPDRPVRSDSLYRLSYPGPQKTHNAVDKLLVSLNRLCERPALLKDESDTLPYFLHFFFGSIWIKFCAGGVHNSLFRSYEVCEIGSVKVMRNMGGGGVNEFPSVLSTFVVRFE